MTLRKITVDNSVKHFSQSEQTQLVSRERERNSKSETIKKKTSDKNFSQKIKKIIENIAGERFKITN